MIHVIIDFSQGIPLQIHIHCGRNLQFPPTASARDGSGCNPFVQFQCGEGVQRTLTKTLTSGMSGRGHGRRTLCNIEAFLIEWEYPF